MNRFDLEGKGNNRIELLQSKEFRDVSWIQDSEFDASDRFKIIFTDIISGLEVEAFEKRLKKAKNFTDLESIEQSDEEKKLSPGKLIKKLRDSIPGNNSDGSPEILSKSIGHDANDGVRFLPPIRRYIKDSLN